MLSRKTRKKHNEVLYRKKQPLSLYLTKWLNYMDNTLVSDQSTEQRILEAARRVFVVKGFAGARMQEIADAAGINKALLHYYFRSKEKLFEQIFREAFGRLLPGLAEIFSRPLPFFRKIELFTETYISLVIEQPYLPVFVLSEMHRNPDDFFQKHIQPEMLASIRQIGRQFAEAAQEGLIRPIDPRQLMLNIMSLCVFPFVGRPMLQRMMQVNDTEYQQLMEARRQSVSAFIIQAIQP